MTDDAQARANTLIFATSFPPLPLPNDDVDAADRAALVGALAALQSDGQIYDHAERAIKLLIEQFKSDSIVSI